jgi:hypothetical protein
MSARTLPPTFGEREGKVRFRMGRCAFSRPRTTATKTHNPEQIAQNNEHTQTMLGRVSRGATDPFSRHHVYPLSLSRISRTCVCCYCF